MPAAGRPRRGAFSRRSSPNPTRASATSCWRPDRGHPGHGDEEQDVPAGGRGWPADEHPEPRVVGQVPGAEGDGGPCQPLQPAQADGPAHRDQHADRRQLATDLDGRPGGPSGPSPAPGGRPDQGRGRAHRGDRRRRPPRRSTNWRIVAAVEPGRCGFDPTGPDAKVPRRASATRAALAAAPRVRRRHEPPSPATARCVPSPRCCKLRSRADVAQLVEQRFCKPPVPGSSPVVGSNAKKPFVRVHHGAAAPSTAAIHVGRLSRW